MYLKLCACAVAGADAARFAAASALNCEVHVRSIWHDEYLEEMFKEEGRWQPGLLLEKGLSSVSAGSVMYGDSWDKSGYLSKDAGKDFEHPGKGPILWLGCKESFDFQPALASTRYGNEPPTHE